MVDNNLNQQTITNTLSQLKAQVAKGPTSTTISSADKSKLSKAIAESKPVKTVDMAAAQSFIAKETRDKLMTNLSGLVKTPIAAVSARGASIPRTSTQARADAAAILSSPDGTNNSPKPAPVGYEIRQIPAMTLTAMHRYGLGPALGEEEDINRAGGPVNWLRAQTTAPLDFGGDYRRTSDMLDIYESRHPLGGFNNTTWAMFWNAYTEEWGKFLRDAVSTRMPFAFAWAMFWFNHYGTIHKMDYLDMGSAKLGMLGTAFIKDVVLPNMFRKFEDIQLASFNNAGMSFHLNGETDGRNPNQNYAREVLELHTVGREERYYRNSGAPMYTTNTIQELSYIFSGRVVRMTPFAGNDQYAPGVRGSIFGYRGTHAHPGGTATSTPLPYLGRPFDLRPFLNYTLDRYPVDAHYIQWHIEDEQTKVMRQIANHPAVAWHLAEKLVRYFVGDVGMERGTSRALITELATVWNNTGGDLGAVARALVSYPGVLTTNNMYIPKKFANPQQWVIKTLRTSGLFSLKPAGSTEPAALNDSQRAMIQTALFEYLRKMGMKFGYAPDVRGYLPEDSNWKTPSGMLQRLLIASEIGELIKGRESARSLYNRTIATIRLNFSRSPSILNLTSNQHTALLVSEEFLKR